ncbi:hypothetical protein ACGC1H_007439 [Rhizoctonia solani]
MVSTLACEMISVICQGDKCGCATLRSHFNRPRPHIFNLGTRLEELPHYPSILSLSMGSTSIKDLAAELVIRILHFCDDYRSIVRFSTTSRRYIRLVKNSVTLQLRIELGANGMEIIGESTNDYHDPALLQRLRRYLEVWVDPKPFRVIHEDTPAVFVRSHLQLVPNKGLLRVNPVWLHVDTLERFPTSIRKHQEYAFDAEQDLSVQIHDLWDVSHWTIYIHLQSIASGSPHPLAQYPVLKVAINPGPSYVRESCRLMRNILVVVFHPFRYESRRGLPSDIALWDWQSGNLLYRIALPVVGRCEVAFLDRSHLLVYTTTPTEYPDRERSPTFLIYSISPVPSDLNQAGPYFHLNSNPPHNISLRLEFPDLLESCSLFKPDSLSRSLHSNTVGQLVLSQVIYSSAVTLRLHLMMYQGERHFLVFISGSKLREYLHQGRSGTIKWDEWGESATRWLEGVSFQASRTPGPRYFEVTKSSGNRIGRLSVFDFHPPSMRRQLSRISSETNAYKRSKLAARIKLIDSDSPSIIDGIFKHPVVSRLPYTLMTKGWDAPLCSSWVADGEYIVGIKHCSYISVYKLHN